MAIPQEMMEKRDLVWPAILAEIRARLFPVVQQKTPTCSAWEERGRASPFIMMGLTIVFS
jgi:hypothetical protein